MADSPAWGHAPRGSSAAQPVAFGGFKRGSVRDMTSSKQPDVAGAPGGNADDKQGRGAMGGVPVEIPAGLASMLLEASPDCVKLIDPRGIVSYINTAGCKLIEIDDPGAIVGSAWRDLWPEAARATIERATADALRGEVVRFSDACPTAKGTSKWWDVIVNPVRGASGAVEHLLCVSRDVTAQKMAEVSLKASEQRFRALAENMAQFAWMAYPSGYVFWHNQRWFDYTGIDPVEAVGDGWHEVIHPDFAERVVRQLKRSFESGETWEDTFPMRGADGAYRWFLSRAMTLRDDQGRVVLWCGTDTDITDQRRLSERLLKHQRVIELSHEAMLVWELGEGIILFNRGCEELYGYGKSEVLGTVPAELLKTRYPMSLDALLKHLEIEGKWSGELLQLSKDGAEIWVDSRLELIRTGGRSLVVETNRDITERRKSDDVRNLLVGELNHRVKNTLAIVQAIVAQTARSSTTVDQFVAGVVGRIQSMSSAHHMLTEAHWSGASLREIATSQIEVSAGETRSVEIIGDDVFVPPQTALQLTLMLHELATNAVKHGSLSRPEGRVTVSWTTEDRDDPHIILLWTERGGPPVAPPVARGFGTVLLERSGKLPHLKARLEFDPKGVVCRIEASLGATADPDQTYFNPRRHRLAGTAAS
jgi:PAS domain S-box-containing protein